MYKKMKANKKSKIKGTQFYKVGDKVETIKADIGAWFAADIIDISPKLICECEGECQCTYTLAFEGDEDNDVLDIVERKLSEIRQVSYSSLDWDELKVGMKVVINYNILKPKNWGYWYDYIIEDIEKRNDTYFLKGKLLVGFDGILQKVPVKIDSDNVADILKIRPHATLEEKEMEGYETGVKPEYCNKCKNKPKAKCRICCCCKCGMKKDFELTVQCDECADWYHIYCIKPSIQKLPEDEDWYCPKCNNETYHARLKKIQKLNRKSKETRSERKNKKKKKILESINRRLAKEPIPKFVPKDEVLKKETKNISKEDKIWSQIKDLFPDYEIIQVTAEVIKKNNLNCIIGSAEEFINNDKANELLWLEAKQTLVNGREAFLDSVKRIFTCAICCELLNDPITLSCKHNFCIDCFFKSLSVNVYNCALCRVDVIHTQHYGVNENLKKALSLLFEKKDL